MQENLRELILSDARGSVGRVEDGVSGWSDGDVVELEKWEELEEYLDEVCSLGLERLIRETDVLTGESVRLKKQLENVACGNYRSLIESFECAGAVREGVGAIRSRLDELVDALPELADSARRFRIEAVAAETERVGRERTLAEYGLVMELLEIPRLLLTLVRGDLYDEALELVAYVKKLNLIHGDVPAIADVERETLLIADLMVGQLLAVLRTAIQLPMCLRIVGYLRRLNAFSESTLRKTFLNCRGEWMRNALDVTTAPTLQGRLVRLADDTRAMIFEVVTQYRAVFSDDRDGGEHAGILQDWTLNCVLCFVAEIQKQVLDIPDGASLATVLHQCMYCGQSLGRVGADFRGLLPPIFGDAVQQLFGDHLSSANKRFESMVGEYRWTAVASTTQDDTGGSKDGVPSRDDDQFAPPAAVLDYPPLAVLLNGILSALNEVRSCAPIALAPVLARDLERSLLNTVEVLSRVRPKLIEKHHCSHFQSMVIMLRDVVTIHAALCLDRCMNRRSLLKMEAIQQATAALLDEEPSDHDEGTEREEQENDTQDLMGR
mmetsp:Transcript_17708/g.36758  ORF Transcript_17708/g.36758 Transcript_17708/m.36758 type:complete len:550 (-) Transcript_17708:1263-2912(-)